MTREKLIEGLLERIQDLDWKLAPLEQERTAAFTVLHALEAEKEAETENPGTPAEKPKVEGKKRGRPRKQDTQAVPASSAGAATEESEAQRETDGDEASSSDEEAAQ